MITSFMTPTGLHAVRVIHQKGLTSIEAVAFCKTEGDAGKGVHQVADWAFDGRAKYGEIPICGKCAQAVVSLKKEPPK